MMLGGQGGLSLRAGSFFLRLASTVVDEGDGLQTETVSESLTFGLVF